MPEKSLEGGGWVRLELFDLSHNLRLDFRLLPGPVFDPPRAMSAGSFSEQRLVIEPTITFKSRARKRKSVR